MFKVMLVEDEVFVREGLKELIQWARLGYAIVGEANNGKEALDQIERLKPDVVITDIRMPILDGLELIRSVKEGTALDPAFIIISGYHDFGYAHQAIRYGVRDYILKPIDEEEMTAALRKLADHMSEKSAARRTREEYGAGSILEMLIGGNIAPEEAESYASALGIAKESTLVYAIVEIHAAPRDKITGLKQVQEVLHSMDTLTYRIPVIDQGYGKFGMLLCDEWIAGRERGILKTLENIRAGLSRRIAESISIFAGDPVSSIADVRKSSLEASEAIRHKYAEDIGVIAYSQIKDKSLHVFDINQSMINQLIMQLEEGDRDAYQSTVNSIFEEFRDKRFTPQAVTGSLSLCMSGIFSVVKEMEGSEEGVRWLKEMAEREHDNWSLQMLKEHFTLAIMEAEAYITRLRREPKGGIKKIKRYIDAHYCENISLKSIAARFYMNPVYLGRLFRKNYGVYFNDYVLHRRVEEAKKLLRQTDLRMYEIAARVGFQSPDYFVTQFEKLVDLSPTEYRNKLMDNE